MEIAELNLISDFEAGIKCLQNPSLISKLSLTSKLPQSSYTLWTYGALIFAVFATFTNIFNKIKTFINQACLKLLHSYRNYSYSSPKQIFSDDDFDFDFSSDDDTPSSVPESDDEDFDSENDRTDEVFREEGGYYEGQNGNFTLRRRNGFSWSDFSAGKSVVQLWDSFGLGLDFEDDESEISIWDLDRDVKISSGRRLQVSPPAVVESVVLTAEVDGGNGGVGFGTFDSRVDETSPAICATWRPRRRSGKASA